MILILRNLFATLINKDVNVYIHNIEVQRKEHLLSYLTYNQPFPKESKAVLLINLLDIYSPSYNVLFFTPVAA